MLQVQKEAHMQMRVSKQIIMMFISLYSLFWRRLAMNPGLLKSSQRQSELRVTYPT